MKEFTNNVWMEYDDREYENKEKVLKEVIKKYGLTSDRIKTDDELLKKAVKELQERSKLSIREIAKLFDIGRETLRTRLSIPPSP